MSDASKQRDQGGLAVFLSIGCLVVFLVVITAAGSLFVIQAQNAAAMRQEVAAMKQEMQQREELIAQRDQAIQSSKDAIEKFQTEIEARDALLQKD